MKPWLHKVESFVDRAIPYTLILLAGIIIIEIFFKEFAHEHALIITILDYAILTFFVVDLIFKYLRIRKFKQFIKECWLDIIAVFPFVLFFRVFESLSLFVRLPAEFREGQSIMHTILEGKKEFAEFFGRSSKLIEDTKLIGEISRTEKIIKAVRPLARSPGLIKALPFYEKPTGKHHLHEMEEIGEAGKGIMKAEKAVEKEGIKIGKSISKEEKKIKKEILDFQKSMKKD
ncbi:MAG: hypothetical protein V1734_04820 [Nanoarchaeota archaeon]